MIINILFFVLLECLSLQLFAHASEKNDESRCIQTIAQMLKIHQEENLLSIWPNFDLLDRPLVFHFSNERAYAFGMAEGSPFWESSEISLPSPLPPFHPAYSLGGQKVFVIRLNNLQGNFYLSLLTFIHERFHLYQFDYFDKERIFQPPLADYSSVEMLVAIEVELRLLKRFLHAIGKEDKINALKDFLVASRKRRGGLHPNSIRWEDHQQKMEGLADYVSLKFFDVHRTIPEFDIEDIILTMRSMKNAGLTHSEDAWKGQHYFVGAVLGWALDFCGHPDWKNKISKKGTSLHSLLEEMLAMDESEYRSRCLLLEQRMDLEEIRRTIAVQEENKRKEKEEIKRQFSDQEGILVYIGTPPGPMSAGGTHQKRHRIESQTAYTNDTSFAVTRDEKWSLRFHAIPLIFEESNGDRLCKLPGRTIVEIDGESFELEELIEGQKKEIAFSSLDLKQEHCNLHSRRPGVIDVQDKRLNFKFY